METTMRLSLGFRLGLAEVWSGCVKVQCYCWAGSSSASVRLCLNSLRLFNLRACFCRHSSIREPHSLKLLGLMQPGYQA